MGMCFLSLNDMLTINDDGLNKSVSINMCNNALMSIQMKVCVCVIFL